MKYERLYYTIGQVSKISGLPQSVLRYWETVFDALVPPKSEGGTRQYTEDNVELILEIKRLLYDEGYTIKGANKLINTTKMRIESLVPQPKVETNPLPNFQLNPTTKVPEISSKNTPSQNEMLEYVIQQLKSILRNLD